MDLSWVHDPWAFFKVVEEEIGPRPEGCTLDRKDNDGNYEAGNLRWATWPEQMANRRSVSALTAENQKLQAEVARLTELLAVHHP